MGAVIGWITAYGSYVGFVVQIIFYLVVAGSAAWAAFTFAGYVRYMTADGSTTEQKSPSSVPDKAIEKFVD